jgi:hypothetical protein
MAEDAKRPAKVALKSKDYRVLTADTFSVRVSNHMAQLAFSIDTIDETERECLMLENTVVLTLPSFKVLTIILANSLASMEKEIGPIPLAPGKEEELRKILGIVAPETATDKKKQPPPDR